ncbi:hypothetical protein CIB95_11840 [Lottiidibacillus patelloidae]|uniref:protein acetyllysine N-acetyltransferase n=1 Tax=Lottiidibacillus patelloidae TaxID=2670334 RepID=A0A263BRW8_9BACI|nr:Sir2 family NAD-dependent protein deacetylase [Lottiidibacillus patelloidae]OZM56460.1 hypothetical protein CIB95_11840 [Lottiidibacillus patelloidae]
MVLHDNIEQKFYAFTEAEAWDLIHKFKCINAKAIVKNLDSFKKKEIEPLDSSYLPFYHTAWHIPIDKLPNDVKASSAFQANIDRLLNNEIQHHVNKKMRQWKRKNKDFIFNFQKKNYYLKNCIDVAQLLGKAKKIVVLTGPDIWKETSLPVYDISKMTNPSFQSIKQLFENYISFQDERVVQHVMDLIEPTPAHQFIANLEEKAAVTVFTECADDFHEKAGSTNVHHLTPNVYKWQCKACLSSVQLNELIQKGNTRCTKPNCQGELTYENNKTKVIEMQKVIIQEADIILFFGKSNHEKMITLNKEVTKVLFSNDAKTATDYEMDINIAGPFSMVLPEVDSHIVKKGRSLCDVCHTRVSAGAFSSTFAPVTVSICVTCSARGAQPYGVLVTYYAIRKHDWGSYNPSPKIQYITKATLKTCNITKEQFEKDVDERVKIMSQKQIK